MCLLTETRALSAQGEKRALVGNLIMPALEQIRQGIRERFGATASRAACDYGTTTAPTTSLMISRRAMPGSFTTSTVSLPASCNFLCSAVEKIPHLAE